MSATKSGNIINLGELMPFNTFRNDHLNWRVQQPYDAEELLTAIIMAHAYSVLCSNTEQQTLALKFVRDYELVAERLGKERAEKRDNYRNKY